MHSMDTNKIHITSDLVLSVWCNADTMWHVLRIKLDIVSASVYAVTEGQFSCFICCFLEQCVHVLRTVQLLPESQTLCEVEGWQPAQWWQVITEGKRKPGLRLLRILGWYGLLRHVVAFNRESTAFAERCSFWCLRTIYVTDAPLFTMRLRSH